MKLSDPCNRDFYKAYHSSGKRAITDIKWLVLHDTESAPGSARGVASYFESPGSGGSAHIVVDDNSCYRCLANEDIPWAAPPANTNGWHAEMVGYASWSRVTWLKHVNTIRRVAYKFAQHIKQFREQYDHNIPVRFVDAAGLKVGNYGITTHSEISKAWGKSDHTDPGPGFPMPVLIWMVKYYLKRL